MAFTQAGGNILAFCEIEPFCQKVLRKHWPEVPIFADIHGLSKQVIRNEGIHQTVDIVYGGFPCQPFSVAGLKKGQNDNRYLWPEFSRLVGEIKPRWVVAENVPGILRIAADTVCGDLERQGYSVGIWDFEAASVGAHHRRERIFFVAHAGRELLQGSNKQGDLRTEAESRASAHTELSSSTYAPNPDSERCEEQRQFFKTEQEHAGLERSSRGCTKSCLGGMVNGLSVGMDGNGLTFWEKIPEPTERIAHGVKDRVNRLKALGNAVVPQQAYPIFKAIMEVEA